MNDFKFVIQRPQFGKSIELGHSFMIPGLWHRFIIYFFSRESFRLHELLPRELVSFNFLLLMLFNFLLFAFIFIYFCFPSQDSFCHFEFFIYFQKWSNLVWRTRFRNSQARNSWTIYHSSLSLFCSRDFLLQNLSQVLCVCKSRIKQMQCKEIQVISADLRN